MTDIDSVWFARQGHPVFPARGKLSYPRGTSWQKIASADVADASALFSGLPEHCGYGVVTGSGLVVVDVDTDPTPEGIELPETLTVRSARGRHYYYATSRPVGNGAKLFGGVVDIRGDGGYVMGPGSPWAVPKDIDPKQREPWLDDAGEPHGRYAVEHVALLAPAPEWLYAVRTTEAPTDVPESAPVDDLPWLVRVELDRDVEKGQRSERFHALIGACRDSGLSAGQALTVAQSHPASVTKYGKRLPLEVARSWDKVEDKPVKDTRAYTGDGEGWNNLGNARRLQRAYPGLFLWVPEMGEWRTWDGARWSPNQGAMSRLFFSVVDDYLPDVTVPAPGEEKAHRAWLSTQGSARAVTDTLTVARTLESVDLSAADFDAEPHYLGTPGGTVILADDGWRIHPAESRHRITMLTASEPWILAEAPVWAEFLAVALPDDEVRAFFQRLAGYTLYGSNPDRIMVVPKGPSSTGKSTALNTLGRALGDYAVTMTPALLKTKGGDSPRPDIIKSMTARIVIMSEASEGWNLHADHVKWLTGNEPISARGMQSNKYVTRTPSFTPWMGTNGWPTIADADNALFRRLVPVPFEISGADLDRAAKAVDETRETAGVLLWMLDGWDQYRERGLDIPHSVNLARADMQDDLSPHVRWYTERCESAPGHEVSASDLWDDYISWAGVQRMTDTEIKSQTSFGRFLTDLGHIGRKEHGVKVRSGLRLKPHARQPF